jgi:hypothetical protein
LRRPSQIAFTGGLCVVTAEAKPSDSAAVAQHGVPVGTPLTWTGGMSARLNGVRPSFGPGTWWEFRCRTEVDASGTSSGLVLGYPRDVNNLVGGELDWFETGHDVDRVGYSTFLHWPNQTSHHATRFVHPDDAAEWHDFACLWEPQRIRVWRNGVLAGDLTDPSKVTQAPQNLCIQLDLYGDTPLPVPVRHFVDYVRVFQQPA